MQQPLYGELLPTNHKTISDGGKSCDAVTRQTPQIAMQEPLYGELLTANPKT